MNLLFSIYHTIIYDRDLICNYKNSQYWILSINAIWNDNFLCILFIKWYAIRKDPTKRSKSMFRNLFTGESDNISAGLFIIFELVRVAGLLIWVSYFNSMPFISRCILFTVCQSLFFTIIVIQIPFIRVAVNVMKILNETTYFILSVFLKFL